MSLNNPYKAQDTPPRVVIVGGGCGGIEAARALRNTPVQVILLDRVNHYLFQALLYQVAGGMLDTGDIAFPIREILQKQKNVFVAQAEVTGVNKEKRCVYVSHRKHPVHYDYLILATGAKGSYFGHDEWAKFAPGLKTLRDGIRLRSKILRAFERAELQENPESRPELFTFVLVGAGPTGCETAGALAEMVRYTLKSDFRHFDPGLTRIILVDAAPRVLPSFSPALSEKARVRLEKMGVEVRLGQTVEKIDEEGVIVSGERINSLNVLWMAGVTASPAGQWLGVETDRVGRVKVAPDLTVPECPEIFVVGDTALVTGKDGKPLPGVAQVAMQGGRYAGRTISGRVTGRPPLPSFKYFDKGNLATIGRNYAILESGNVKLAGFAANLVWAFIHIYFLLQKEDRFVVFLKWAFNYITQRRSSRIIEEAVMCGSGSDAVQKK